MSIQSQINRLQNAKTALKTAIEGKGVTVPSSTKLDGYADLVDSISGGSSSSDGWAYFYYNGCYADDFSRVYNYITQSNVTLEINYWLDASYTGWMPKQLPVKATTNTNYIPVYFRAKANSSAGGYFQFGTNGHMCKVTVMKFEDVDTSINYIGKIEAINGGAS